MCGAYGYNSGAGKIKMTTIINLHPNDVFYVFVSYWQPDPEAANPEMPGRKAIMTMLMPAISGMTCVCGSGKYFSSCCKRRNYWIPVCINPDFESYSKMEIHSAIYQPLDCAALKEALMSDERFRCNNDGNQSYHWLFHNNSPRRFTDYGEVNLGDIELKPDGSLLVTAMSAARMEALRAILENRMGLDGPQLEIESVKGRIPKPMSLKEMMPHISEGIAKAKQLKVSVRN